MIYYPFLVSIIVIAISLKPVEVIAAKPGSEDVFKPDYTINESITRGGKKCPKCGKD